MSRINANVPKVLQVAASQIGVTESPRGSDRTPYTRWYGFTGPWCAMFVSWVFHHAGSPLPRITSTKGFSYTPDGVAWAKRNGQWKTSNPRPGDLIFFSFSGRRVDHVGIVVKRLADGRIETIEGNTSNSVQRRYRRAGIVGYVTVHNTAAPAPAPAPKPAPAPSKPLTPEQWKQIRRLAAAQFLPPTQSMPDLSPGQKNLHVVNLQRVLNLVSGAGLVEDGDYGARTKVAVENFQRFLAPHVKDRAGYAHRFTRFFLVQSLINVRDGKA